MAPFSSNDADQLDLQLMQNGAVTLYFKTAILEKDLAWFREHGYQVESIDCRDLAGFRCWMRRVLQFKEQPGYDEWTGDLDTTNDAFCLEVDSEGGLVLCFLRYDLLKAANPRIAQDVLDIIEWHSRDYLLFGRRLLAVVQSDDPTIQFDKLGARGANWNRQEWLKKNREH